VKIVHLLLESGVGVAAPDYDLLRNAVEDNRFDIVSTLVEHGAENKVERTSRPSPRYTNLGQLSQIIKSKDDDLRQYPNDKLNKHETDASEGDMEQEKHSALVHTTK
jgi:hypothetical protein